MNDKKRMALAEMSALRPTIRPTSRKNGAETAERSAPAGEEILWKTRLLPLKPCGRRPYQIFTHEALVPSQ